MCTSSTSTRCESCTRATASSPSTPSSSASRSRLQRQPELAKQAEVVVDVPVLRDLPVAEAEELCSAKDEALAVARNPEELSPLGPAHGPVGCSTVLLGDEHLDVELHVRGGFPVQGGDALQPFEGRSVVGRRVVDVVGGEELVDRFDIPPDPDLVVVVADERSAVHDP